MKRTLMGLLALFALCLGAAAAPAAYPERPVRVVIGYPPGGGTDIVGRIVLQHVAARTGWHIVIDNVPGATGVIGTRRAAEAKPDGYTLLLGHTAPNAINPGDFTVPKQVADWKLDAVCMVARAPALLLVRPETGVRDYPGFVAWARGARTLTYGSDGVGSQAHLLMHSLLASLQVSQRPVHVPYKGGAPALQGLLAGDVPAAFSPAPVALPHLGSGPMRNLSSQPVSSVQWVHRDKLSSNDYNPNHVAPPELELLILSILANGYTCPIVVGEDMVIIDGFHRWHTSADPRLASEYGGMVPITVIPGDRVERMAATVRHNRARGEHGVMPMAVLVRSMMEAGLTQPEVMRRLGMEDEEVIRLSDRAGMPQRMANRGTDSFGKSWVPTRG